MPTRVYISDLDKHVGEQVELCGWLHNKRKGGKLLFLVFRDGTGFMQAVVSRNDVEEGVWLAAKELTQLGLGTACLPAIRPVTKSPRTRRVNLVRPR